ncbi:MAG: helix-turn-helix transcriptional regulator [candidate division WOR-3 bacterium]
MKRVRTTLAFPKELGERLRGIRKKAGLTQTELATLMGRNGTGAHNQISRLERGIQPFPSLALIADYLRACRARFADLLDILDSYTSQPVVSDAETEAALTRLTQQLPSDASSAVIKYEKKTTNRQAMPTVGKRPVLLSPAQRVLRMQKMFARQYHSEVLEASLHRALVGLGKAVPLSLQRVTCDYGRKVFAALVRGRKLVPQCRTELPRRGVAAAIQTKLNRIRAKARKHGVTEKALEAMASAAQQAYDQLNRERRLDWIPSPQEIAALGIRPFKVTKAETRMELAAARADGDYWKQREFIKVLIALKVDKKLDKLHLDSDVRRNVWLWVGTLFDVLADRGKEAAARLAKVGMRRVKDKVLTRDIADKVFELFERYEQKLKPRPPEESRT